MRRPLAAAWPSLRSASAAQFNQAAFFFARAAFFAESNSFASSTAARLPGSQLFPARLMKRVNILMLSRRFHSRSMQLYPHL